MARVFLDRDEASIRRQGAGDPHAAVAAEGTELQGSARSNGAQQHMDQLAFVGRDVDRGEVLLGVSRSDAREDLIFSGEQLLDVALQPLVHD